jgi:hypothetical protein
MRINTTHGEMADSKLTKRNGVIDTDKEHTVWVEYWLGGDSKCPHKLKDPVDDRMCSLGCEAELVQNDSHVTMKKPAVFATPKVAQFR